MSKLIITDPEHLREIRSIYNEQSDDPEWSFGFVAKEHYGEWRWGNLYLLVIRDRTNQQLWGTVVREQGGDHYYLSLDEDTEVDFEPVREIQTVSYELVR